MKRKLLIFFLTVISAVCLCLSVSACDILSEYIDISSLVQSTQNSSDNSTEQSASDSGTEQSTSGGNSAGQSTSGSDNSTEQSATDDSSTDDSQSSGGQTSTDSSTDSSSSSSSEASSSDTGTGEDSGDQEATDFTVRAGNCNYGYLQLASETNGAAMQSIYYQMYEACEEFTTNTEDISKTGDYYTISEISYSGTLTTNEAISVWRVFYIENPMYYWLSSSCVYSDAGSTIYLCIDEAYASYTVRANYDAAIATMVTEAGTAVAAQSTDLEKAMAIHDYIISKIDYAYQSDGATPETAIWAHNITGVSSIGAGVCEAYSKTYLALCLINGLDCVIVTGKATSSGEAHAWNLVKIDGIWYGVDCTWDDTGDNDDLSYTYFGMNASTINSTRTTGTATYGISYQYALPDVTDYGIQLVTLFKGETEMGMYVNIDAAFAAMTDATADYTIEFYFSNTAGTMVYTSPSTTMYIYATTTPAVNSITINGVYTALDGGYFYVSYLNIDSKFTLNCNLTVSNIIFTAADLDLGDYTLTTDGVYCRLNGSIYDSKTADTVSIKSETSSQTAIYATLNVSYYYGSALIAGTANIGTYYGSASLNVYGGKVTIGTYISANETTYYNIYVQESSTLTVSNLVYDSNSSKIIYVLIQFNSIEKYPSIYLGNVDAQTNLYISGSVSSSEAATPENLSCTIATLGSADEFTYVKIYFDNTNKTSLYKVNTDNEIVYSGN